MAGVPSAGVSPERGSWHFNRPILAPSDTNLLNLVEKLETVEVQRHVSVVKLCLVGVCGVI